MNVEKFLFCETPDEWVASVNEHLAVLLIDHANCEKKAASTALNLIYRYVDKPDMLIQLSKLAREELRHFEQVLGHLQKRGIEYRHLPPGRYAGELRKGIRTYEPARLVDVLIVSAIVEGRSCERFSRLIEVLDDELARFYTSLLKSEARHYKLYLNLARKFSAVSIDRRVDFFLKEDQLLVTKPDDVFRFLSGPVNQEDNSG
ncbi:MAG TPA: tRNA-(ms[2]io[6]A)-hydroxylase [Pseudomonadales bacterium]|nr:tRNA-(ms[2]io[6]A)-hydroxylase [Pseudomonadales bacterium]